MNQLLVVAHALAAIVVSGSVGHLGLLGLGRLRGKEQAARLGLHARVSFVGLSITFAFGLLAYPHYRVDVRGMVLDREAPWASNLFDIKENLAAFTLPLVLAVIAMERDRAAPRLSAAFCVITASMTAFMVISGLLVTLVHGP